MNDANNKHYIQFSKRIVMAVTAAVSLVVLTGVIFAFLNNDCKEMTDIIEAYIQYDMVVFVAYSGNSVAEKWLNAKSGTSPLLNKTDDTDSSQG